MTGLHSYRLLTIHVMHERLVTICEQSIIRTKEYDFNAVSVICLSIERCSMKMKNVLVISMYRRHYIFNDRRQPLEKPVAIASSNKK